MKFCAAFGCSNRHYDISLSFHKFPSKTRPEYEKWCQNVGRCDENGNLWHPKSAHNFLCSNHFTPESFVELEEGLTRRRLRPTAIPTIFSFKEVEEKQLQGAHRKVALKTVPPLQAKLNVCPSISEPQIKNNFQAIDDNDTAELTIIDIDTTECTIIDNDASENVYHDQHNVLDASNLRKRILELENENSNLRRKLKKSNVKSQKQKSKLIEIFKELKQEKRINESALELIRSLATR